MSFSSLLQTSNSSAVHLVPLPHARGWEAGHCRVAFGIYSFKFFKCISGQRISFILPIPSGRLRPGGVVVPVTITPLSIPAMAYLSSVNETKIDSNFISAAHNLWYSYSCALVWWQNLQSWLAMNNSVLQLLKDIDTIYVTFICHFSLSWIRVFVFSSPLQSPCTWPCIKHYYTPTKILRVLSFMGSTDFMIGQPMPSQDERRCRMWH